LIVSNEAEERRPEAQVEGPSMEVAVIKPEEMSHPPKDQLLGMDYCLDSNPSWGKHLALCDSYG
jgi:hypothetical protein